jgi:vacuolar-type H+-ATPase subunit H
LERAGSVARCAAVGGAAGLGEGAFINLLSKTRPQNIPDVGNTSRVVNKVASKVRDVANSDVGDIVPSSKPGMLQRLRNVGKAEPIVESDSARATIEAILNRAKRDSTRTGDATSSAAKRLSYEIGDVAREINTNGIKQGISNRAKRDIRTTKSAATKLKGKAVDARKKYLGFEYPEYAIREFGGVRLSVDVPRKTLGVIGAGAGLIAGGASSIADSTARIRGHRDRDINNIYDIANPDLRSRVYRDYMSEPNQRRIRNSDIKETTGSALVSGGIGALAGLGASQVGGTAYKQLRNAVLNRNLTKQTNATKGS